MGLLIVMNGHTVASPLRVFVQAERTCTEATFQGHFVDDHSVFHIVASV